MQNKNKILFIFLLTFLSFTFVSCGNAETTEPKTMIEIVLSDLADEGYTYVEKDQSYLNSFWEFGGTYELLEGEYTIFNSNDEFAAYIQVFDEETSAQAHLDAQWFTGFESQVMVIYENLLIAAMDYDVIEIVTGDVYTTE